MRTHINEPPCLSRNLSKASFVSDIVLFPFAKKICHAIIRKTTFNTNAALGLIAHFCIEKDSVFFVYVFLKHFSLYFSSPFEGKLVSM